MRKYFALVAAFLFYATSSFASVANKSLEVPGLLFFLSSPPATESTPGHFFTVSCPDCTDGVLEKVEIRAYRASFDGPLEMLGLYKGILVTNSEEEARVEYLDDVGNSIKIKVDRSENVSTAPLFYRAKVDVKLLTGVRILPSQGRSFFAQEYQPEPALRAFNEIAGPSAVKSIPGELVNCSNSLMTN